MKYIKAFESNLEYKIDIFTIDEAYTFFYQNFLKKKGNKDYNLKDKIHYFDYYDFNNRFSNDLYSKSCKLIIAHNDKDILGICKFAYWEGSKNYAISYLSSNKDFFSMGVSKKLLETLFKYFSEIYPNEILNFSGYSVDGWKYLRKSILELSKKYNVKIKEKGIEYPGIDGLKPDFYDLVSKSKEEIKKIYGSDDY